MKKRRTLIISMLLIAALCLGIGYAAVAATDTLTIGGTISANKDLMNNEFDEDVYFSAVVTDTSKLKTSSATVSATITPDNVAPNNGGDVGVFTVTGLAEVGESVTATYTIKNDYTTSVWVTIENDEVSDGVLKVKSDKLTSVEIEAGKTLDVKVVAEVIALADDPQPLAYTLTYTATTEAPAASN